MTEPFWVVVAGPLFGPFRCEGPFGTKAVADAYRREYRCRIGLSAFSMPLTEPEPDWVERLAARRAEAAVASPETAGDEIPAMG